MRYASGRLTFKIKPPLNATVINLREFRHLQKPSPRTYINNSFRLLSASIQRLEICLYIALEQARKLQQPAKASAIVQCRHHRFTINFNGNFLKEFRYNCHPRTDVPDNHRKYLLEKQLFSSLFILRVLARSLLFCGCGGKQHFIWKLGIVRTSSGVKKWTYRFVTLDSTVHTIFFSRYRSGSSRGQKNNECGLLSNVPRLCL